MQCPKVSDLVLGWIRAAQKCLLDKELLMVSTVSVDIVYPRSPETLDTQSFELIYF